MIFVVNKAHANYIARGAISVIQSESNCFAASFLEAGLSQSKVASKSMFLFLLIRTGFRYVFSIYGIVGMDSQQQIESHNFYLCRTQKIREAKPRWLESLCVRLEEDGVGEKLL